MFLQTIILINKIISSYLFNYKNFIIFLKLFIFKEIKSFLIYFTKNRCLHLGLLYPNSQRNFVIVWAMLLLCSPSIAPDIVSISNKSTSFVV